MDRTAQNQAAAQRARAIAEERRRKMPQWREPTSEPSDLQRQRSREFISALGGYDAYLAAKAATAVDSSDPAISDADSDPTHMLTA